MGRKLDAFEQELYQRTDELLHYVWDPIGVSGIPSARDEYNSYLPQVFSMLVESRKPEDIAMYLAEVEEQRMGLTPNRGKASQVAVSLVDWYENLHAKHTCQ